MIEPNSLKLAAFLAHAGIAARRRAEELILEGKVKVNDRVEKNVATRVVPGRDRVEFAGKVVEPEGEKLLLALNKPRGVVSTVSDPSGKPTVIDFIPKEFAHLRLYPVGRLDEDSEGLILLTNDGRFSQHVTHPKFEVEKVYEVTIGGRLSEAEMSRIERGVPLKDGVTKPAELTVLKDGGDFQVIELHLHEGRYHEIRRIMKALNHEVRRLVRREIGPYQLGKLKPGSVRREIIQEL